MFKIIMLMAITADGKIARTNNHYSNWTSKEDKKIFSKISKKCGVVIMGKKTFDTFPSPLKDRLNVVFSSKKKLPTLKNVKWASGEIEPVLKELKEMGYNSAVLGGGSFLNSLFLEKELIDEIILTVEPKIFGEGLSLFNKNFNIELKLKKLKKINKNSFTIHYKISYK